MTKTLESPTILCVHTNRWASSLVRMLADYPGWRPSNLQWALDIDDMMAEAKKSSGTACVVELNSQTSGLIEQFHALAKASNNPFGCRLFVVGDYGLIHWRSALRIAGIAMSCHSTVQVEQLRTQIQMHHENQHVNKVSIEVWAESNLPWPNFGDADAVNSKDANAEFTD